jgi:hypothetical protein
VKDAGMGAMYSIGRVFDALDRNPRLRVTALVVHTVLVVSLICVPLLLLLVQ